MALGKQIKACREYLGWTLQQLSDLSGVEDGTINALENRDSSRSKYARNIANAFGLSVDELENGEMPKLTSSIPTTLGPAIQTPLRPIRTIDNPDEIEHDVFTIPRYSVQPSMGAGEPVMEIDEHGEPNYMRRSWARRRNLKPENLFTVVAVGNSMEPEIKDGASVTINRQPQLLDNKLMMICYRHQCYIKRVLLQGDGSVVLRSENRANYKDIEIGPDALDELHVVGLVVSVSQDVW